MSHVIDVLFNGMNVRLGESESKRKDCLGMVSARMRPARRNMITFLVKE